MLDQDAIRKIQLALKAKGVDPKEIDGKLGPHTREAVKLFQEQQGLGETGELDHQTLKALEVI